MRAVAILIALVACKDKQAAAPAPSPPPPAPSPTVPRDAAPPHLTEPASPTPKTQPLGGPLSIEDAKAALPALDGGKEILPLRQTSDKRQVHATWCLDGDAADTVARSVGQQLANAQYTDIAVRGDSKKAGVQATRDGFRISMIVSGSSAANCQAPKHYFASATIFREP